MTSNVMKLTRAVNIVGVTDVLFCASKGQFSLAAQRLCFGLLYHHSGVDGSPLSKAGAQRG